MEALTISIPATQEEVVKALAAINEEIAATDRKLKNLHAHKSALQQICSHPTKERNTDYCGDTDVWCTVCGRYL